MSKLHFILLSVVLTSIYTDCNREEDACKFGVCGIAYVRAKLSIPNDTMYVGDSLIIEMTIPDSIYQIGEGGDTTWEHVNTFKNMWSCYNFMLIDTTAKYAQGNPEIQPVILEGGEMQGRTFSEIYPYRNKILYVLKKPGTYFLSTCGDLNCRINDRVQGMIIEWEVPEKHFEWLEPATTMYNNYHQEHITELDSADIQNFFPFRVIER